MVIMKRACMYADSWRDYKIYVDEKVVEYISDGEVIVLDLPKGKHKMYLKLDWCRSNEIEFEVNEDDDVCIRCGNSLNRFQMFFGLFYVLFRRNKYLYLKFYRIKQYD